MTQKCFFFLISGCIGIVLLIAHRFLLSADCLLLRQLFSEAPRLVHRHEEVPEAPGILRPEKGHDSEGSLNSPAASLRLCGSAT